MMDLILASASPRRRELLQQIGAVFVVEESREKETPDLTRKPKEIVQQLALQKAQAVAAQHREGIVLGADTVVVIDDEILGKPKNSEDAASMLRRLSGRRHEVMTGVALVDASGSREAWTQTEITGVEFRELSEEDIQAYLETGESTDKAGAYGIQGYGALLVTKIDGDYFNIVGLPLQCVAAGLQNWGLNLYDYANARAEKRPDGRTAP